MNIKNKKWTEDEFFEVRNDVLNQWETGKEVDLEEAVQYLKSIPKSKCFVTKLIEAKKNGIILVQPRAGVGFIDDHIQLLKGLETDGRVDLLPTTIDSYTRQNQFESCNIGIEESVRLGRSMLNGFPAVNYGVKGCRRVFESVNIPLQVRHGTPDARLLSEIIYASGWTSNEGGGISYNIPYAKHVSLERSILDWQYCDRLTGLYEEMGIRLNREPYGPLTGTLIPPCISIAVAIIEGLLAAEQGVTNITLGYGQGGNLNQDVAAIKVMSELATHYFQTFGYNVDLTTVFHHWMGGFPTDETQATGLIAWGTTTAALAGVNKIIVKTPQEGKGVPTMQANVFACKFTKNILELLKGQQMFNSIELEHEMSVIREETTALIEKVIELGSGDIARGTVEAFRLGTLDIPFAPSKFNLGKVLPARDCLGAIRFFECGNLPFSKELKNYHRDLMERRAMKEGRKLNFQLVSDDIIAVSKGFLVGR